MFTNFSDFNFEVIDVLATKTDPEIIINKNAITLSLKLLEELGKPQFIRPLVDFQNKAFALRVCKESDSKALKLRNTKEKVEKSCSISCVAVRKILRRLMKETWKDDKRYRLIGTIFPKEKAVAFDLTQAEELEGYPKRQKKSYKKYSSI